MAYGAELTHLCVGQGLSVLLKVVYKYSNIEGRFVALFDLGSSEGGEEFYGNSLAEITKQVIRNGGILNYVHISHLDADHYNLFSKLAKLYTAKTAQKIQIERLVIGSAGKMSNIEICRRTTCFALYQLINPVQLQYNRTQWKYRTGNPYSFLDTAPVTCDVNLCISPNRYLRINTLLYHAHLFPGLPGMSKSVSINTGSSMVLIAIVDGRDVPLSSALFTGDATRHTMQRFITNGAFTFGTERKTLTISHHGTKIHVADDDNINFTTLNNFLSVYTPTGAIVSAKCRNMKGWAHPDINTINAYVARVTGREASHRVTCFRYDTTKKMVVCQKQTTAMVNTTFQLMNTQDQTAYSIAKRRTSDYCLWNITQNLHPD